MQVRSDKSPHIEQLEKLLSVQNLPPAVLRLGTRLLGRLTSDIQVVLAGPAEKGKSLVFDTLTAGGLASADIRLIDWGTDVLQQEADICIWFTLVFDAEEQNLWSKMPNRLKDHSFLVPVLQKSYGVDQFDAASMDKMKEIAIEEFSGLIPVSLPRRKGHLLTQETEAMVHEISNTIKQGMMADVDNVHRFLAEHPPVQFAPVEPQKRLEDIPPLTEAVLLPKSPAPIVEQSSPVDLGQFKFALDEMHSQIKLLEPLMKANTDAEFAQILRICSQVLNALAVTMSECDGLGLDDFQSAADETLLMSMEGGIGPAIAALTAVLQIKREFEIEVQANVQLFT